MAANTSGGRGSGVLVGSGVAAAAMEVMGGAATGVGEAVAEGNDGNCGCGTERRSIGAVVGLSRGLPRNGVVGRWLAAMARNPADPTTKSTTASTNGARLGMPPWWHGKVCPPHRGNP